MNKKIVFLIVFLVVFLFSCNYNEKSTIKGSMQGSFSKSGTDVPAYGDRIVTSMPDDIYNLNFLDFKTASENEIIYLISDSLVSYNNSLNIVPRLAKKWQINKNHTEITFYLRKGVKFSDGVEFTSADVKYSYLCVFDPKNGLQDIADSLKDLKKVETPDKYTVKFTFSTPQSFVMDYFVDYFILPKHIYDTNKYSFKDNPANKKPVGTGPFKLVKWIKDKEIVLKANDSYFLGRPYLDEIVYLKGGSLNVDFERMKKGEFDILPISITTWKFKTGLPEIEKNFVKYRYFLLAFYFIAWNTHRKPFDNRKVRLAFAYLSDLERFNKLAFFGLYKVAVSPLHPQSRYYNKNLSPFPFDVARAKKLLKDAGFEDRDKDGFLEDKSGKDLTVRILTENLGGMYKQIPVYFQQNFKKAGVKVIIDTVERGVFIKKLSSMDYDGVLYGWMIFPTPTYLYSMFKPPSKNSFSMNINKYINPDIIDLLDKLSHSFNEEDRLNICYRIQNILYKEQPYLFLFYPSALVLAHKRYRNLKPSPLGMFKWYPGIAKVYVPKRLQKKY